MSTPEFFVTPGYGEYMREHLHYSQAVKIGNRVETSGQGGWDDEFQIPTDLAEEIAQAFHNLERTLATAGARWEHVIHVNSYHVGGFPPKSTRRWSSTTANTCPTMRRSGRKSVSNPWVCRPCAWKSA
ncbi:Rid family hydrolase [Pseudomonas pergaminensis]